MTGDRWLEGCCSPDNIESASGGSGYASPGSERYNCCYKLYEDHKNGRLSEPDFGRTFFPGSSCCMAVGDSFAECQKDYCNPSSSYTALKKNTLYYNPEAAECCGSGPNNNKVEGNWEDYCCLLTSSSGSSTFNVTTGSGYDASTEQLYDEFMYSDVNSTLACCNKRSKGSNPPVYYYVPSYKSKGCQKGGVVGKCASYRQDHLGFYCGPEDVCLPWPFHGFSAPTNVSYMQSCCDTYNDKESSSYGTAKSDCCDYWLSDNISTLKSSELAENCCSGMYSSSSYYPNFKSKCCLLPHFSEEHTGTGTDKFCGCGNITCSGRFSLNEDTCKCQCNTDSFSCPAGQKKNSRLCTCVCDSTSITCPTNYKANELTCECECDEEALTANCRFGTPNTSTCTCDSDLNPPTPCTKTCGTNYVLNLSPCQCECNLKFGTPYQSKITRDNNTCKNTCIEGLEQIGGSSISPVCSCPSSLNDYCSVNYVENQIDTYWNRVKLYCMHYTANCYQNNDMSGTHTVKTGCCVCQSPSAASSACYCKIGADCNNWINASSGIQCTGGMGYKTITRNLPTSYCK